MRPRISIRGLVRPSVGWLVRRLVTQSSKLMKNGFLWTSCKKKGKMKKWLEDASLTSGSCYCYVCNEHDRLLGCLAPIKCKKCELSKLITSDEGFMTRNNLIKSLINV